MEKVTIIGVDLAKNVFQLHGATADGSVVFHKAQRGLRRPAILINSASKSIKSIWL